MLNFAQGEIGAFGVALFALLNAGYGVPYWFAFALAVGASALIGLVIEMTVVRRLFHSPRLVLLIATIGVGQLLLVARLALPDTAAAATFPLPFSGVWHPTGSLVVFARDVLVLIVAPVSIIALALFMTRTKLGLLVRASASNPDTARLYGISVKRTSTIVWTIAGGFAGLTAIMIAPIQGITPGSIVRAGTEAIGPALLLRALVVSLIARLRSLPLTLVGGLAVGLFEGIVLANVDSANRSIVDLYLFFATLVLVLFVHRGRRAEASWSLAARVKPVPERLAAALVRAAPRGGRIRRAVRRVGGPPGVPDPTLAGVPLDRRRDLRHGRVADLAVDRLGRAGVARPVHVRRARRPEHGRAHARTRHPRAVRTLHDERAPAVGRRGRGLRVARCDRLGDRRHPRVARARPAARGDHVRVRRRRDELAVRPVGLHRRRVRLHHSAHPTARDRFDRLRGPPQLLLPLSRLPVGADGHGRAPAANRRGSIDDRGARQRGDGGRVDGLSATGAPGRVRDLGRDGGVRGLPVRDPAHAGQPHGDVHVRRITAPRVDRDHRWPRVGDGPGARRVVRPRSPGDLRRRAAGAAPHERHRPAHLAHVLPRRADADRVRVARRRLRLGRAAIAAARISSPRRRPDARGPFGRTTRRDRADDGRALGAWGECQLRRQPCRQRRLDLGASRRARRPDRHQRRRQVDTAQRHLRFRAVDGRDRRARPRCQRLARARVATAPDSAAASSRPGSTRTSRSANR